MAAPWAWLTALVVALAVVTAAAGTAGTSEQRRRQMRSLLRRLNKDPLASIQVLLDDILDFSTYFNYCGY
jgi:hypothetical protein